MKPSRLQEAPRIWFACPEIAAIRTTAPPTVGTFRSSRSRKNPIQAPSGEKNGASAPSVSGTG